MDAGAYYYRYPIRCRTCGRTVDNKARDLELLLRGYPDATKADLLRCMDTVGLTLYCCRRYILAPTRVPFDMQNMPVVEGLKPVDEAVAMEARQHAEGNLVFNHCIPVDIQMANTGTQAAAIPALVAHEQVPVQRIPVVPIPVSMPGVTVTNRSSPGIITLRSLQSGINQDANTTEVMEGVKKADFVVPTMAGIPTYNPPTNPNYTVVMMPVGNHHYTEVISGVTFLAI